MGHALFLGETLNFSILADFGRFWLILTNSVDMGNRFQTLINHVYL